MPVRVDDADVGGIVVTTTKLAKVAGRIVFEGGAPEKSAPIRVAAETSSALSAVSVGGWPHAEVRNDFTFELTGLFGPHIITLTGQPPGWVVKSVKYREADITDTPVEFKTSTDPAALEITLSRQGAVVSGRVLDGAGKGIDAGYVLLFSADPARRQFGLSSVKTTRPKADGSFTLGTVRAGEYVIVAVSRRVADVSGVPGCSRARTGRAGRRADPARRKREA